MKYMGSKNRIAKFILPIMLAEAQNQGLTTWVEPFCLDKNTRVFTENGMTNIGSLEVGDKICCDNGEFSQVVGKYTSEKKNGVKVKLTGNVVINSTEDHLFYKSNGEEVSAGSLKVGDSLLIGRSENSNCTLIDIARFITIAKSGVKGSRGGRVVQDKVMLYHNAAPVDRFVKVDEDFCWAAGLVVAEGSPASISLHIDETDIANKFLNIYKKITGLSFNNDDTFYYKDGVKSLHVAIPCPKLYETIFFKATNIGYGACNKSIHFAFNLGVNEAKAFVKGMHTGDGCIRTKNGRYKSWNYKTASESIAYQLQALLSIKFGIKSTMSSGMNNERFIKGRLLKKSKYFNISVNHISDVERLTDIKWQDTISRESQRGFVVKSIESCEGEYYDIKLEKGSTHRFIIDGGIVTHNCGGANTLDKVPSSFKRIGYDLNPHTVHALVAIRDMLDKLPDSVSEQEYKSYKGTEASPITSWVRFASSYGGKFENGYARSSDNKGLPRNHNKEAKRNAQKQSPNLQGVYLLNQSYDSIIFQEPSLIYCDPPYQGTTGYKTGAFDHDKFFDWCRQKKSEGHTVFVSEYQAPDDFELVWQGEVKTNFASTRKGATHTAVEKLFKV